MPNRSINLRVIKLEYSIPEIHLDFIKQNKKLNGSFKIRHHGVSQDVLQKYTVPKKCTPVPEINIPDLPQTNINLLVEDLLQDIYGRRHTDSFCLSRDYLESETSTSVTSHYPFDDQDLCQFDIHDLNRLIKNLERRRQQVGSLLAKKLYRRDLLKRRRKRLNAAITVFLQKIQYGEGDEGDMRFSTSPRGGASGWAEWLKAMKLVARLPTGVPPEFRKKLWLTLAEQHLKVKGVDWTKAEKNCFSEWKNPDDTELGVQIVKDLHRTGCSLFCGAEGRENQAVLKRVLLAYARWNKAVGYCQGFNMLAALILEVMDRSESDSLKVMIYLIEAVLPEGYFANNLRGLSVDMAVFRDLLKLRLPKLSAHLDKLQKGAAEGSVYEPPLTNVFTMQWFLTLFCNCLPHDTVLRVWDLAFLEGDAVLLTTALAIWENLQSRILKVESADEFYSVMGELARETLEAPPGRGEQLIAAAAKFGPIPELPKLRDKHRYNITPWAHSVQSAAKKGLRLFYADDEVDSSDDGDKLAITTAYGIQGGNSNRGKSALMAAGVFGHPDREKLALDISSLKQQYERLRERQRQAHIILAAACARQTHVGGSGSGPMSVNHLLLGKSAIVSNRGRRLGPPQGAIPPSRTSKSSKSSSKSSKKEPPETIKWTEENQKKVQSRRDSIKWKDIKQQSVQSDDIVTDPEDNGQVSDSEVNEIIQTSMRTRRRSESSSYSECSESSTSTSLCDEPNRMSDFDSEPASASDNAVFADDILEANANRETAGNVGIKSDRDDFGYKSDKEFGAYIQEFEDLLDRTNSMDDDRGLICVLPDSEDELNKNVKDITDSDSVIQSDDCENNVKGYERFNNDYQLESKKYDCESNISRPLISDDDDKNIVPESIDISPMKEDYKQYLISNEDEKKESEKEIPFEAEIKVEKPIEDFGTKYDSSLIKMDFEKPSLTETIEKRILSPDNTVIKKDPEVKSDKKVSNTLENTISIQKINEILDHDSSDTHAISHQKPIETKIFTKKEEKSEIKSNDMFKIIDSHVCVETKAYVKREEKLERKDSLETKFSNYMDSLRGEQLKSYLNEFKRAELQRKPDVFQSDMDKSDVFQEIQNASAVDETLFNDDQEVASICDDSRNIDKEDTATIRTISSFEYRSTSGDRSISSSLSSVSPILRTTPGLIEEKPSFISFKSPCRESELPVEISEDEKPLVLTIDKYFEHSPEFFGARKFNYTSSDEEDERYANRRKNYIHKSKYTPPPKNDNKKLFLYDLKNEISHGDANSGSSHPERRSKSVFDDSDIELPYTSQDSKLFADKIISPSISSTTKSFSTLKSPETFKHKRISSLDSPLSVKYLTKMEPRESTVFDGESLTTPTKSLEHGRGHNILEKTKSEELPRNQMKSFSVLDEEIDANRVGRRNSERALKIIQENSNILHSILVNQVNKCHTRETLLEESYIGSSEEINDRVSLTDVPFKKHKTVKMLPSPRSTSFDDRLLKSEVTKPLYLSDDTEEYIKYPISAKRVVSPSTSKVTHEEIHNVSERRNLAQRPRSFESHIILDNPALDDCYQSVLKRREITFSKDVDENKTDRFGWENKGFEAKQRYSSIFKDEGLTKTELSLNIGETSKTPYTFDYKYSHTKIQSPKGITKLDESVKPECSHSKVVSPKAIPGIDDVKQESNLSSKYKLDREMSPILEKNSSLTSVSETILDSFDCKFRDPNDSSKIEGNLSTSELNLSPSYKHSYKSTDISSYANSSYRNLKLNELHPPIFAENYSRVTESSPVDSSYNNKPEILKFETSHSSDLCVISSSMSFSFDPSVEDHTSTKPGTFNSSDTLCQLTSLDQVSTPISPKVPVYSTIKDFSGVPHNDLASELDRFKETSEDVSFKHNSYSDTLSGCTASLRTPTSPASSRDKNGIVKSPDKSFSPFPTRSSTRQPKEVGLRLGLYKDSIKSPTK